MASAMVLLVAALRLSRDIVIPVVLAVLISFILAPAAVYLQRSGLGRAASVILVVSLALVVVVAFGVVLAAEVTELVEELPQYQGMIAAKIAQVRESTQQGWLDKVTKALGNISEEVKQRTAPPPEPEIKEPVRVEVQQPTYVLLQSAALSLLGGLLKVGLILVLVCFMLARREDLRNRVIRLWGTRNITGMTKGLDDVGQRLSRYLLMQLLINAAYGTAVGVGLQLVAFTFTGEPFPYAFVAGLLAGASRYVPYLGPWIGAIFPILVGLAVYPSWAPLLWVAGLILVLELLIGNVFEPLLYGHTIGVSEVALLLAAAFWAWLWGPIGLVLAPPMTVCLAVAGRFIPQLEFLDVLLSNKPALEPHVTFFQRLLARDHDEAAELVEDYAAQHPDKSVFDDVLAPALVLTERNLQSGQLAAEEGAAVFQTMREILDEIDVPVNSPTGDEPTETAPGVLVFGVPARDAADELILGMWGRMLPQHKCQLKIVSPEILASELIEQIRADKPAIACLSVVPVNRLTHVRYLCHRLRTQFPRLKILVLCVGLERTGYRERLNAAGADAVVDSLIGARDWLLPLLPVVSAAGENPHGVDDETSTKKSIHRAAAKAQLRQLAASKPHAAE